MVLSSSCSDFSLSRRHCPMTGSKQIWHARLEGCHVAVINSSGAINLQALTRTWRINVFCALHVWLSSICLMLETKLPLRTLSDSKCTAMSYPKRPVFQEKPYFGDLWTLTMEENTSSAAFCGVQRWLMLLPLQWKHQKCSTRCWFMVDDFWLLTARKHKWFYFHSEESSQVHHCQKLHHASHGIWLHEMVFPALIFTKQPLYHPCHSTVDPPSQFACHFFSVYPPSKQA